MSVTLAERGISQGNSENPKGPRNREEILENARQFGSQQLNLGAVLFEVEVPNKLGELEPRHRALVYELTQRRMVRVWDLDPERGVGKHAETHPLDSFFSSYPIPKESSPENPEPSSQIPEQKYIFLQNKLREFNEADMITDNVAFYTGADRKVSMFVLNDDGVVTHSYRLDFDRGEILTQPQDESSRLGHYIHKYEGNFP